jgi:hypothetical protein
LLAVSAGLPLGLGVLLLVHFVLQSTYWDYSEGVYAMTSHLMIHGGDLYGQIVGAQPPGVFLAGAALLLIHDGLEWLRFGIACFQLGAGLIAAWIVWRLTENRLATALTPAAALLTPWAVHEHGALTPELVSLPVLLGAVAFAAEERHARWAGLLAGVAPLLKLPFLIPAVAIVAASAAPRRVGLWAIGTLAIGAGLTTLLAGTNVWHDAVYAQLQVGTRPFRILKGFWAQAGWNLLGLAIGAGAALYYRAQARHRILFRLSVAFAVAMIVSFLTNVKPGTGLNVTVPVEAALVPLAITGTVFAIRAASRRPLDGAGRRRTPKLLATVSVAGLAFVLAQTISLLVSPGHSEPFLRAGSRPAWGILMTASQTKAAVLHAQTCPSGVPYAGPPLIAFLAGRSMPDNQPDQFLPENSSALGGVAAKVAAVHPVCS